MSTETITTNEEIVFGDNQIICALCISYIDADCKTKIPYRLV